MLVFVWMFSVETVQHRKRTNTVTSVLSQRDRLHVAVVDVENFHIGQRWSFGDFQNTTSIPLLVLAEHRQHQVVCSNHQTGKYHYQKKILKLKTHSLSASHCHQCPVSPDFIALRVTTLQTMCNSLMVRGILRGTQHVKCYSYHSRTSTKYLYGCKYAAYHKQF